MSFGCKALSILFHSASDRVMGGWPTPENCQPMGFDNMQNRGEILVGAVAELLADHLHTCDHAADIMVRLEEEQTSAIMQVKKEC